MKKLTSVLFLALSFLTTLASAAPSPEYLFHWTSARGLNRWADVITEKNNFVFELIDPHSFFIGVYPEFSGREGVFTWSNIASGTGSFSNGTREWYAREGNGRYEPIVPPRLVAIRLAPDRPVLELNTYLDYSTYPPNFVRRDNRISQLDQGTKTGLVLHRVYDQNTGEVKLQEYILLKRSFVESITASPIANRTMVEAELARLRSGRPYSPAEIHSPADADTAGINSTELRKIVIKKLERALSVSPRELPPFFSEVMCREVFR